MRAIPPVLRTLFAAVCFFVALGSVSLLSGRASFSNAPRVSQPQPTQRHAMQQPNASPAKARFGPRLRVETGSLPNFEWKAATNAGTMALFAPMVTAVKSAMLGTDVNGNGFVNPGDTLMYSVLVSNTGTEALNVVFTDQLNANLTLMGVATASPIGTNDSYTCIGNVGITVPDGAGDLLANDVSPDGTAITVTAVNTAGTQGTVMFNANGSFSFMPTAGFEGMTTFTYTVTSSNGKTDTGTVTITVSEVIWFIDNNGSNGDGRLGTPFNSIANFNSGATDEAGDIIFVYRISASDYTASSLMLLADQKLIGQGSTASLATSFTPNLTIPPFSNALPATGGTRPTLTNTNTNVTVSTGNTIRGVNIQNSSAGSALLGTSFNNLTISETTVSSSSATAAVNLDQGSSTASINVTFISVAASSCTNGIILRDTTGTFTVTGTGGTCSNSGNCTGGAINNTTGVGVMLNNARNVSLTRMFIGNTGSHGVSGFSMSDGTGGVSPTFELVNSRVTSPGDADNETALYFGRSTEIGNNTGRIRIADAVVEQFEENGLEVYNNTGTLTVDVTGTLSGLTDSTMKFDDNNDTHGQQGVLITAAGTANITSNVSGAFFNNIEFVALDIRAEGASAVIDVNWIGNVSINGGGPDNFPSGGGFQIVQDVSGSATFDIKGNTIRDLQGDCIVVIAEGPTQGRIGGPLVSDGNVLSGSLVGDGIRIDTDQLLASGPQPGNNFTATILIQNNQIGNDASFPGIGDDGIQILHRDGTKTLNLTIENNTIANCASEALRYFTDADISDGVNQPNGSVRIVNNNISAIGVSDAVFWQAQDSARLCLHMSGNTFPAAGNRNISLNQSGTGSLQITQASVAALATANTNSTSSSTGTITFNGTCTNPPTPTNSFGPVGGGGGGQTASLGRQPTPLTRLKNWLHPIFAAFTTPLGYVQLDHAFNKVVETVAPTVAADKRYATGSGSNPVPAGTSSRNHPLATARGTDARPPKTMIVNSRGEYTIVPTAALPKLMAGELITINGTGSGFTLPAGESTTVMFNAQISSSYTLPSISNQASVSGTGFGPILSNNLATNVIQPPALTKSFSPANIATNGTATLQFALLNTNNSQTLTQMTFTDVLPVGLNVTDGSQSACGGTVTRTAATRTIALTGGSLAVGPPCVFTVTVTAGATEGTLTNTTGAPDSLESDPGTAATANINVINPPTFSKAFGAPTVPLNGTTSLTFTITNTSALFSLNGIGFTDTLPTGLIVATPSSGLSTTCSGTPSATAGGGTVSLSGATLASGASCTLTVNVTATTGGAKDNSATLATTELGATSATTGTVTLNVFAPPTISKAFGAASVPLYTSGSDVSFRTSLTFTITNPAGNPANLTGVAFSDTLPPGLVIANGPFTASGSCGSSPVPTLGGTVGMNLFTASGMQVAVGSPCTVTLNVRGTTAGTKNNVSGNVTSTEGGTNNGAGGTASASIDVFAPPTIAKAFGASVVSPNTPTTMSFTITNPAGNPGNLTGVAFNDTLMSGLQIAPTPGLGNNGFCGSPTLTGFTSGSTSLMVSGATVTTANQCVITVNVVGTMAGTVNNTTTAITSTNGGTGATSNTATLIVASPPTVAKAFAPSLITPGGTSTVTITLSNPNASLNLTGAMLTDTLPAGVTTVNASAATTCVGGTATQMTNSVSLSGGTIPMGGSCTLTVDVTSAANGVYTNTINPGDLSTANSGPNTNTASDTLTVAAPPTISKVFAPNPITSGGTSTLTITLTNPNSNVPLTLSSPLTDTLPVNVTTQPVTHANTCGGTSSQTGGSVTLTGGTIPVSGSCTLSVDVTSTTAGGHVNTIAAGALVTNGGSNANPATASLVVGAAPQVTKDFTATALKTGDTTTLTISIANNNGALPFNDVSYTDTLPTGLTVPDAAATGACGGTLTVASNVITLTGATIAAGATCTTTFTVTGATVGVKNNTVTVDTSNFGIGYTGTDTVTVYDVPTITKGFAPTSVPFGGTSTLSFTLTNPNSFSGGDLSGLSFTDTLPSGMTVTSGSAAGCGGTLMRTAPSTINFTGGTLGTAGPGNTCTISVIVTGTQLGMHTNTVNALTSTQTGTNTVNAAATLTVTQSPTTTTITNAATLSTTPTVVGQPYAVNVTVAPSMGGMGTPTGTVNVSDGSGATCTITLSGGSGTCNLTSTSVGTPKTISASYLGDTNFATSSTTASHTVNKADTSLSSLTDSPDPSVVGQPYTVGFTLTVTNPGAGTPTGTVTVNDGAGGMCTATLPATSCQLTSNVAGNKTLTFTYNGDANFNGSTNTAGHGVNKADTMVAITDDTPDPSVFGQNYAVTASVTVNSPGGGTPGGTITVTDGTNNCTINLPGGTSCNLPSTSVGPKTLTATYSGDANYNGSGPSAGVLHTVNKAEVTVAITSDNPDSSAVGQNVTVAFTVAAAAPGAGTPTNTVTVTVSGGSETCTGSLVAGSGSCTLALTVPGSRTLTATYNGDDNFNTGTDTDPHTVVAPPSISKAFNPPSVPVGGTSTLTFTITNPAANTVELTGVGFTDTFPNAPNLVVANPTGASLTGCGGGTLTDNLGGALAPGDLGVMLSGATVGVGGTCTVSVNVTPQAQGPFNNVSGNVSSTNGGTGNTASATLLTNAPPTITPINLSRAAGSTTANLTIANVNDLEDPENQLVVQISTDGTNFFDSITMGNVTVTLVDQVAGGSVNPTAAGAVIATISTPCNATVGPLNLFLRVTDLGGQMDTEPWTLTITPNPPPTLMYANQTITAGAAGIINPATGPSDNGTINPLVLQSIVPAVGLTLSLNPTTGQLMVTSATLIGNYAVTVAATDNCGATTNATFNVNVICPTITLAPATLPNGVLGTAYNQTVSAGPAGTTYSYAVTVNTLPPGLSLNSATGALTGTPTASGNYAFGITATGWGGCTKTQSYNLLITGTCATITVNPTTLPGATIGTPYNQTVSASPAGTYTFAVTQGALPPGLALNTSTGVLSGTPTGGGSFSFRITATGAGGCTGSRNYVLTVTCATFTFAPTTLPGGTKNVPYSQTITVTPAGTYTFNLLVGSLPPGFTLSSAGVLSGVTNQTGTFNFTVRAISGSCQGTKSYSLVISAGMAAMAQLADYNGDGKSDFALWSPSGTWRLALSGEGAQRQTQTLSWGMKGDLTLLGDYDGDGQTDLAVFRPANGTWYIKQSGAGGVLVKTWGTADDVPVPGDYDGDGRTDIAVFRPSDGNWYVWRSSDQESVVTAWGAGYAPYHDVAVPGDYDGDGQTDLAVFRRSTGTWLVKRSSDGQFTAKAWGVGSDVAVAADYDGDGRTDFAVWRQGTWYIWQSASASLRQEEWGASAAPYFDRIVPGDYDGDGQADITVWRAGEQTWYVRCSVNGSVLSQTQGQAGDRPVTDNH